MRAPRALFAVLLSAGSFLGAGCELDLVGTGPASLTYTEDARRAYQEALNAFNDQEYEDAAAMFGEVKQLFPQSRYARLAQLRLADIAFAQSKFTDAIAGYREFVTTHRTDRDVEYARYRMSKALFLDIEDSFLLPPAEERDMATTLEAYRELRSFMRQYPRTRYRRDTVYMVEVVTGRLVRHELYVARYYLREDALEAALARVDYAIDNYPGSGLDPEALVLKGETLMKLFRRDEAREVFQLVIDDHGGPFAVTAQAFLDELGAPTQPPSQIRRAKVDPKETSGDEEQRTGEPPTENPKGGDPAGAPESAPEKAEPTG